MDFKKFLFLTETTGYYITFVVLVQFAEVKNI